MNMIHSFNSMNMTQELKKDAEYLVFSKRGNRYDYNRTSSTETEQLVVKLKKAYDCLDCLITPSGMNAISSIIQTLLKVFKGERINIIYGDQMYLDTPDLIEYLVKNKRKVNLHKIDIMDTKIYVIYLNTGFMITLIFC